MSETRRRSTRRVKKGAAYAVNDLVQIPRSSGTTVIGRLVSKVSESSPSGPGRWLCSFDDGSHHKDEELTEDALGPIVGHVDQETNSSSAGDSSSSPGGSVDANRPVTTLVTVAPANPATDNKSVSTRSHRRRNSSDKSLGGNSGSSADEKSSKGGGSGGSSGNNRKKTVSFSSKQERGVTAEHATDASVLVKDDGTKSDNAKTVTTPSTTRNSSIVASSPVPSSKVSDREQRSRRRQAVSHDEIALQQYDADAFAVPSAANGTSATATSSTTATNKRSIHIGSGSPTTSKHKKAKMGSTSSRDGEVLKVKLLTGTLFLYRGAHRRAEFIPKY